MRAGFRLSLAPYYRFLYEHLSDGGDGKLELDEKEDC